MPKVTEAYLEARRQEILDAACACFAYNGFHETTMQDICREAKLSPGAVYRYFASKEDIIEASWQRDQQTRTTRFGVAQQKGDTLQVLDELIDVYMSRLYQPDTDTSRRIRVQFFAEALRNSRIQETICRTWDDVLQRLEEIIHHAQEQGEINPDLDANATARLFLAMHDGLVLQTTIDPDLDISKLTETFKALYSSNFLHNRGKES